MREMEDDSMDLVLTDPPYGIGADINAERAGGTHGWKYYGITGWDKKPEKEYFDEMRRVSENQIIWGGNYFTDYLPPSSGWLIWDKGQRNFSLADGEMAWTSYKKAMRIYHYSRAKALQDIKVHCTQKAIAVMQWCTLIYRDHYKIILDPFLGSGTTAIACEKMRINWIGIELSQEYCDIAVKRIEKEAKQLKLELT